MLRIHYCTELLVLQSYDTLGYFLKKITDLTSAFILKGRVVVSPCVLYTHSDEGLVEAVEAQVPDESAVGEGRDIPQVEVRHHHEGSAAHHPGEHTERDTHTRVHQGGLGLDSPECHACWPLSTAWGAQGARAL